MWAFSRARLLLVLPGVAIVLADVARRRALLAEYTPAALLQYALFAVLSTLLWAALVVAAAAREGWGRWLARALLAALAFFALGTQAYTYARYGTYLNWRVALMGNSLLPTFAQQLASHRALAVLAYA